ncbi:MAG: hypothetical protein E7543_00345 [Ruminococcaceae bacterium]|nr:hypothetical protein [Oscillospiraceae bacterium]MBQ9913360.1 hypothetical protein [Clostridia bacterium]
MSSVSKEHVKQNCGAAYMVTAILGLVLLAVSVFMYKFVPVSDIANSIEHSGKDALYLLALSPVCALVAAVAYIVGGLTDKALVKNSVVQLVIFIVSAVLSVFVCATSAAMFFDQLSLGFVAPLGDTVWNTLGNVNIIAAVLYAAGNIYIFATARK